MASNFLDDELVVFGGERRPQVAMSCDHRACSGLCLLPTVVDKPLATKILLFRAVLAEAIAVVNLPVAPALTPYFDT